MVAGASVIPSEGSGPTRDGLLGDRRKLHVLGIVVCAAWLASTLWFGVIQARAQPVDFVAFWAAGEMVEAGDAADVYDFERHHQATETFTGPRDHTSMPYLLPPSFLLVARGLALLDYFPAFVLFSVVSMGAFGFLLWRLMADRLAVVLGFASPTTIPNLQIGQIGLLLAIAGAIALWEAERHPWRSGLALGVLSLKPQLGIGIGLALVVARAWRALAAGLVSSLFVVVASGWLFGWDRWPEWRTTASQAVGAMEGIRRQEAPFKGQAVLSVAESFGFHSPVPQLAHAVMVIVVLALVLPVVRREGLTRRAMAMVMVMTVVISPRTLHYDYAFLVPAALWLVQDRRRPEVTTRLALALAAALMGLALLSTPLATPAGLVLLWLADPLDSQRRPAVHRVPVAA
jgi:hypothetical protein